MSPKRPTLSLKGRVALVTGAAGGIGAEIARFYREMGAVVIGVDLPGATLPEGLESRPCDLGDREAIAALVGSLDRLDILVHAAGINRDRVLWKLSEEAWDGVLEINLTAAFSLLRHATPLLRKRGGAVILVTSINGERGKLGQSNYAASKAGLIGFGKTAARELGRFGVRVNLIAPGMVRTPMTRDLSEEIIAQAEADTVLGRIAEPEDIASAALFLASDLSQHITGQVLRVDGGQLIA